MSSPYLVLISARAERDLLRLPEKIGAACLEFIFGPLADNPQRHGGELRGELTGLRSARRASYRVIYLIDDNQTRIEIVHIDHRRDVYR